MPSILLQGKQFKKRLMPFLFPVLLAGCTNLFGNSFSDVLRNDANASSEYYMNKVEVAQNLEDRQTYKLLAARVMISENKIPQAKALLNELKELKPEQQIDKAIIEAHISAITRKNKTATNQLKAIDTTKLSASQTARYYEVAARVAENKRDIIEAVKARIIIDTNLSDVQRKQENIDRTWALLRSANRGTIANTNAEGNVSLGGWLALTQAYNENVNQPTQLSQALQNWKSQYARHSAAYLFPTELNSIINFQQTQMNKVSLLLPLSGGAAILGNTIKSGFTDAKGSNSSIQVEVIDTLSTSMTDAVAQAKQSGSSTIVGPLLKDNLDQIIANPNSVSGLNVLALNSTNNARAIDKLCYYGLAPEDEAESAANRMWKDGIRRPIMLVPQSDLGQRTAQAFNVRWQQLAATDADIRYYTSSADAANNITGNLANDQGIHIVVTSGEQLADIKSSLDNASIKAKIYSNSRNNSANNGAEYRLAMEGVIFSDIPFFKETGQAQYRKIEQATNGDYSLMRLYAMGSDAWLLINSFNELRQVPGFTVSGLTGKISAGPNCNMEREMTWYQYRNGEIVALN